jgi:ankyrin repeat protein
MCITMYILQGGHSVGCDRTHTLTHTLTHSHTTHTHTHMHTHTHTHTHTHAHTQSGRTALHFAAQFGHVGVAEALLKAGCNKDMQDTV